VGSAVNDTTRELGGAVGIAVAGSVVSSAYAPAVTAFFAGSPAPPEAVTQASGGIGRALAVAHVLRDVPIPLAGQYADQLVATAQRAFVDGLHHTVLIAAAVAASGAVAVARYLPDLPAGIRRDPRPATPTVDEPPVAALTSSFRLGQCDRHAGGIRLYLGSAIDGTCPWCEAESHTERTRAWVTAYLDARAEANHWRAVARHRGAPTNGSSLPADPPARRVGTDGA
jgi:hypothetical protein